MVYIISYDLNKQGQNYDELYKRIKAVSNNNCCHPMESTWIIKCDKTSAEITDYISTALDKNDSLFIAEIKTYYGLLRRESWDCISNLFY